ncbi:amidohydrolase family protein [uncultured Roseibium sp.]|uniref:amidohydrolase family protein n=1 Tax=uncultured Roseibium sp. TaxID=1936171 RepID=UPI00262F1C5C|nr:amidohydrolase family protein [uncultured Roseibium sp.]
MADVTTDTEIIAIEEHFMHEALARHLGSAADPASPLGRKLYDFAGVRLEEMDAAGIDMQVLSHQSPGSQTLSGETAVEACRAVNDALAAIIRETPERFAGLAMIPSSAPEAAADELQRAVEELGLKGAMLHGKSCGEFIDAQKFWPIYARAEALDVPIYLHPAQPDRTMVETCYAPYDQSHPALTGPAWGFGVDAGTHAIRLVLSGVFDRHPDLKIILGHMGEALPFWLPRIDESLARPGNAPVRFAEIFKNNFFVTTSGFFSDAALRCCLECLEPDHILFAVDWPYADNRAGVDWLHSHPMGHDWKEAIFSSNARALLKL